MRAIRLLTGIATAAVLAFAMSSLRLGAQDTFRPKSELQLQLHDLAEDRPIDQTCPPFGNAPANKKGSRAQNRAKNNFYATGDPVTMTAGVFKMLQKQVEDRSIPHGSDSALPADRSILANFFNDRGVVIGEGMVVRYVARVITAHYSNTGNGESVNCGEPNQEPNDIHIALGNNENDDECTSVTAEISPHFRPEPWTAMDGYAFEGRPIRLTGQLLFDGSHVPCRPGKETRPKRVSTWEIHPVYAIDVCKSKQLARCRASDESIWQSFDAWVNGHEQ